MIFHSLFLKPSRLTVTVSTINLKLKVCRSTKLSKLRFSTVGEMLFINRKITVRDKGRVDSGMEQPSSDYVLGLVQFLLAPIIIF